jgi:transcription elongation factor GreA
MDNKYYTKEGLEKLKEEVGRLKTVERPLISQQIAEARDKGDLSENAEYDAAKNAQSMLELKISKLEELISNAKIIDETKLNNSKVFILSKVKIKNLSTKALITYTLVPESEADLKAGKISVTSPIARGLLGKKVGDHVEIKVPAGTMTFEIIQITR